MKLSNPAMHLCIVAPIPETIIKLILEPFKELKLDHRIIR